MKPLAAKPGVIGVIGHALQRDATRVADVIGQALHRRRIEAASCAMRRGCQSGYGVCVPLGSGRRWDLGIREKFRQDDLDARTLPVHSIRIFQEIRP